jgi:hypothetical protein
VKDWEFFERREEEMLRGGGSEREGLKRRVKERGGVDGDWGG